MIGTLKLIKVAEATLPVIVIRIYASDIHGNQHSKIMEYELPTNFKPPQLLTGEFVSLQATQ